MTGRLKRTRHELSAFLKSWRERTAPASVGLEAKGRRKTPGLRREEVASLADVGVTWYTWLEQGREISASDEFLEKLALIFNLGYWDRRYLYLLCQQRLPTDKEQPSVSLPKSVMRLVCDLKDRPSFVIDGHWMVIYWNRAADKVFSFSEKPDNLRNLLRLVFLDEKTRALYDPWPCQARQMVSSFRKDVARYGRDSFYSNLIGELGELDIDFKHWWHSHELIAPCAGLRFIKSNGNVQCFEYLTLTVNSEHRLRVVSYAPI
ncbi:MULTISPECIES: helix-turn-helix transcriptional regulator [Xanthomonas]|uniref:helix-turn-helix transcriptional regulator n=1 Tax=Xanthomonas TaxID=338 RepID=UPI0004E75831|nr:MULTISPECIES: helix-turn-helix transcriptional regulator [Xanthomonas]PNV26497.1 transcriptional regulator [Xanthomonas citri]WPM75749.1 helix-turn-helix transcriptional regulator [Xanthomonas citri pv. viticola]